MVNVDPDGLENTKSIIKKKKRKSQFSFVVSNWLLSIGHGKSMGYQNRTFLLKAYGCMDAIKNYCLFGLGYLK